MWKIGIPKLETAFNLSVGPGQGGELSAGAALAWCPWWCPGATLEPHCQPLSAVSISSPHSGERHQNAPSGTFWFPNDCLSCEARTVKWPHEARLIVLFLSSSNSESLGIEFKWVTWRCLAPDAVCWDFAKLTASSAQPCLGLSPSLQIQTQAPMDQFFTHQLWSRVLIWPGPGPRHRWHLGVSELWPTQLLTAEAPLSCSAALLFTHNASHSLNHFPIVGF